MPPYASIAVGVDFTGCCAAAVSHALRIAGWTGATVHVVHVIDRLVLLELEEALAALQRNVRAGLAADARAAWRDFATSIPGADRLDALVVVDDRVEGILRSAREHGADLLVLGAHGTKAADRGVGTVASGCVRRAGIDVLVVREARAGAFRTVVAAVDFSDGSRHALERAAAIAARDGAELHVVHVYRGPWHVLHYRAPTVEAAPHFRRQYRDGLARRLAEFARPVIEAAGVARTRQAVFDHDGHRSGIVEYSEKESADLVVLGARGRSSVRDLLLGSTAERALRATVCSVLAVAPPAPP